MLMMKERRPAFRTIEGWARSVLLDAGAIRECEEHGWMRDRSDPHARERIRLGPSGSAVRHLSRAAGRCCSRRVGYDRRHLSGVPARGMSVLSEMDPRRLKAARQRRLDRARVPPAVDCSPEKKTAPSSILESTACAACVAGVAYEYTHLRHLHRFVPPRPSYAG